MPITTMPGAHQLRCFNNSGATLLEGRAVIFYSDGDECVRLATAGEGFDGTLLYDIPDGGEGVVVTAGNAPIYVDAARAAGLALAVGASGAFTAMATGNYTAARVIQATSAAGPTRGHIYPGAKVGA